MILVDTGVWIDYFNGVHSQQTDKLDSSLNDDVVAIGDLILLDILQGFRTDKEYENARKSLSVLRQFNLLGSDNVTQCAKNYRALRKQGITIRKTADVIIASYCIKHKIPLLFTDRDFQPFVEKLGLVSVSG